MAAVIALKALLMLNFVAANACGLLAAFLLMAR
jgi:hypothetical protein